MIIGIEKTTIHAVISGLLVSILLHVYWPAAALAFCVCLAHFIYVITRRNNPW